MLRMLKDSFTLLLLKNQDLNRVFYSTLTLDMLVVNEHGVIEIAEGVPMRRASPSATVLEFIRGANLIQFMQLFQTQRRLNTSVDIDHFVQMFRYPLLVRGYMLSIHVTLMPLSSRSLATIDAHDFLRYDLPPRMRYSLLQEMGTNDIRIAFAHSFLLKRWLAYSKVEPIDEDGLPTHPSELEIVCLRHLECHKLINKRAVCHELCQQYHWTHGVPPPFYVMNSFSYTQYELRDLVYFKRGMTLYWIYHAVAVGGASYFKILKPHNNYCIGCKFCHLKSGCFREKLLQQYLYNPLRTWPVLTILKVLKLLSKGGNQGYFYSNPSALGEVAEMLQKDMNSHHPEQEIELNFPYPGYGTAIKDFIADFPEAVNLIAGEEFEIFHEADDWCVIRKKSAEFGVVPVRFVHIVTNPS